MLLDTPHFAFSCADWPTTVAITVKALELGSALLATLVVVSIRSCSANKLRAYVVSFDSNHGEWT